MEGPLDDLRVLELASWVAGPSVGALMADMGAAVVKVEPLLGDGMRKKMRQPLTPGDADHDFPFQLDNRGKQSIAVDLTSQRGAELVRSLAAEVDVVITNMLPERLRRYGLDPDTLRADHPRLVYAMVTGFGSTGPDADRAAFDVTAFFGRAAISSMLGEPDEPPPSGRPGQGDHSAGLALLVGIMAALRERDRSGEGQVVETALLRVGAWTIGLDVQTALIDGLQPTQRSRNEAFSPLNTTYQCADGKWLVLSAHDQGRWTDLCAALGRDDLGSDERFATPWTRFEHRKELIAALDDVFATEGRDHWAAVLDRVGMIWAPMNELPDLVDDPQARASGMFTSVDHPAKGTFDTLSTPFTMSESAVRVRGRAPDIGEHTEAVLRALGLDDASISSLREEGIIA